MNTIKKILGPIFIIMGLFAAYYIMKTLALPKFHSEKGEDLIPAIIYTFLMPIISLSLIIFGYYAMTNEYGDEKA